MTDINNAAMKDALTGAYNRKYIDESLPSAQGVIYSDLDDFKRINDYFGGYVGDRVLVETAKIAKTLAQQNQGICFRLRADQFVLLFQTISPVNLENIATELYQQVSSMKLEQFLNIGSSVDQVKIGCSVGVAFSSTPIESKELIERADRAVYLSKQNKSSQNVSDRVKVWEEKKR